MTKLIVHLAAYDHPATWTVCNRNSAQQWKWGTYHLTEFADEATCGNCKRKVKKGVRMSLPTVFNR